MSGAPVALWRVVRLLLHVLHGLAAMALRFGSLDIPGRHALVQWWSTRLLRLFGVELTVHGQARTGATLWVANHVSWLDIAVIHAAAPQARFVAKSDLKHWPVLGWLVAGAGTLFIERRSKRDALRVVHQIAEALRADDAVAVFPEGTTGAGPLPLTFHANLLQAAIATATPVQPLVLRYHQPGQAFSTAVEYVGPTTLWQSLWRVACARELGVQLEWLPALASAGADRRRLAAALQASIARCLAAQAAATNAPVALADSGTWA